MAPSSSVVERWRREFLASDSGRESAVDPASPASQPPEDRIAQAREAMIRLVTDRFGGDGALMARVQSIALSAEDAVAILKNERTTAAPEPTQLEALEAVVVFDGTRPSFLLKSDEIDFATSFNTGTWKRNLNPFLQQLAEHAACVGCIERDGIPQGTAFLVTPTLALTNRHVAQAIARFADDTMTLLGQCALEFGREDGGGRKTYDRRTITAVAFAGAEQVSSPIDHERLDLAVLRVSASKLTGDAAQRHMRIGGTTATDLLDDSRFVAAVGYPSDPELHVPERIWTEYGEVLRKLLEGDGGAKRLAPGQPMTEPRAGLTEWTAIHDATTINGNSGSPLVASPAPGETPRAAALHYGGRFGGDRVNWAHLLYYAGSKPGYGTGDTFAEFCHREGIQLAHG